MNRAMLLLAAAFLCSCGTVPVTKEYLEKRYAKAVAQDGGGLFYYGSAGGYDQVIHVSGAKSREFLVREGELNVGKRFPYKPTRSYRRPIKL